MCVCLCESQNIYIIGRRVEEGESAPTDEAFIGVDVFSSRLEYHDKIKHTIYGLEHEVANAIKQVFCFIKNENASGVMFNKQARKFEMEVLGRFVEQLKPNHRRQFPRPPWVASKEDIARVNKLPALCKTPAEWPAFRKVFADLGFLKTAETLMLAGPVGLYALSFCESLELPYFRTFAAFLRTLQKIVYKSSTPGDRDAIAKDLAHYGTKLEMMMPIAWNTLVMHVLNFHTVSILERTGGFAAGNMLDIENWHTLFKSFGRGTTDIMASFRVHYVLWVASQIGRMDHTSVWHSLPARSSFAGYASRLDSANPQDRVHHFLGKSSKQHLSSEAFRQIITCWRGLHAGYDAFHRKFERLRARLDDIREWVPRSALVPLSEDELKWQGMTDVVEVRSSRRHSFLFCVRIHTNFICIHTKTDLCHIRMTNILFCM